ncbi:branched-chain amino acid ABC transporter permease [uncultured Pseudacidovorax sp.]|uniref:branched-chain amino acid ABC transporter permease n=1 Tax=uncultured Pseudacidovorax sp. TaxID=679313 RepID=UPI001B254714|nr:branched-chain amino acid ABC transporter permease [uncultured Pseudacidovorax sp.]MBO9641907.1 branched-chain amino acid ABC transporter permease [Pseudacidovorax sp.]
MLSQLLSPELLLAALMLASTYALVALGLNLIYGAMRLLDVAHGDIMMLGGYVAWSGLAMWGVNPFVGMVGAMLIAALLGAACYALFFQRMVRNTSIAARLESNSLLIFFSISIILQNVLSLAFTADARSYSFLDSLVRWGDTSIALNRLVVLAISAGATILVLAFLRFGVFGIAIRALIQQRDAAALVGINADRTNRVVFCLGFALAGLAGALISMTESVTPFGGFPYTIAAFVVVILGGLGSLPGALAGGLLLAFVEVYGMALFSAAYRSILVYGLFILILFIRPQGLLGRREHA